MEDPGLSKILEMIQELEERIKKLPDGTKIKATDDIDKCLHPEYNDLNKDKLEVQILSLISLFERMKKWNGQKLENGKKSIINEIVDIEDKLIKLEKYGIQNPRKNFIVRLKDKIDQPPVYEYPYSTNEHFNEWRERIIDYYIKKYGGNPLRRIKLRRLMIPATMGENYPDLVEEVIFLSTDNTLRRMNIRDFKKYVMNKNNEHIKVLIIGPSRYTGFNKYTYDLQADNCSTIEQIVLYNGIEIIYPLDELYNLKSIVLPPTVQYIEPKAFYICNCLESIILPEKIRIGEEAFEGTKLVVDSNGRVSKVKQDDLKRE